MIDREDFMIMIDTGKHDEILDMICALEDKIAMIEAERKPDTLTVPEAVERLVEFFSELDIYVALYLEGSSRMTMIKTYKFNTPDYISAIGNGTTPAAVKVGLEDLFVTILEGDEK